MVLAAADLDGTTLDVTVQCGGDAAESDIVVNAPDRWRSRPPAESGGIQGFLIPTADLFDGCEPTVALLEDYNGERTTQLVIVTYAKAQLRADDVRSAVVVEVGQTAVYVALADDITIRPIRTDETPLAIAFEHADHVFLLSTKGVTIPDAITYITQLTSQSVRQSGTGARHPSPAEP